MVEKRVNGKPNQVIIGFKHLQLRLLLEARPIYTLTHTRIKYKSIYSSIEEKDEGATKKIWMNEWINNDWT